MKATALFFAVFALGATLTVAQDPVGFDTSPYQYQREITGNPVGDRLLRLSFDADLYRHSGPDHRALRLVKEVSGTLTELPRLIVPVDPPARPAGSTRITHRIDSFEENGDGSIEVTLEQTIDADDNTTLILLDGGNLPLHELALDTEDRNFRREVLLQVPGGEAGDAWRTVGRGFVHSYDVGEFREARLSFSFSVRRSDRYRLVIQNGDNPPLRLTRVIGKSRLEEMLFLASADDRLFLFLGEIGDAIAAPRLDTAAIFAAKQNGVERSELKPGPLRENQAYRKEVPADRRLLESKGLLWSIIAIVVAMMIWILYLTLKRIDQIEGEAGEE